MPNTSISKFNQQEIPRMTLRDMLGPLFRHRTVVTVTFAFIFGISVVVALVWARHYYVATMQVVLSRERLDPTLTPQPTTMVQETDKNVSTDDVASEITILQGQDMLREVVQTCGMVHTRPSLWDKFDSRPPELKKAAAIEAETRSVAGRLKVEAQKSSHVIELRYASTAPPESSACVLQTLGKLYLEKHLRLQRPVGALDFFSQETDKYQKALKRSEAELVNFSKIGGLAAPDLVRSNLAQQLAAAHANLYNSRQAVAADQQRIENIKAQMAVTPNRSNTIEASISANLLLDQLKSTLLAAQLKRTQLLLKYDPSYPLVQEVDTEIAQTEEAIAHGEQSRYVNKTTDRDPTYEYLRQDMAKTEADLASEQARATVLSASIHDIQLKMVDLDVKSVEQGALLREAKANEGNYLLYLTKREQERTSDALDARRIANVAIAVPATVPTLPAHSSSSVIFAGFWLALLVAIAAGYLAELADPSLRTPAEVERLLNIPILAAVPRQVA